MRSKKEVFPVESQKIALLCKVLSHPARVEIMRLLSEKDACFSGDISSEIPQLNRVTVSQHLQALQKEGLIKGEVQGTKISYCIDTSLFLDFCADLDAFVEKIKQNCPPKTCC